MHPRAAMFIKERARARARGDRGVERCMNVELARMGYQEPPNTPVPLETATPAPMETAIPEPPRRGRRPKPRCEHDMIAERCPTCNEDLVA